MDSAIIQPSYVPRARAERLIAGGRAVLAAVSLFAIWLDPTEPSRHAQVAYILLAFYLCYALLMVLLVWHSDTPPPRLGLVTHVIDLPAFTLFIYFTEGPTSPLFVYFIFYVLAAALRWRWRGVLWTGLAVLVVFMSMGLYVGYGTHDPLFELNRFIIRSVYLAVLALLLAYISRYEEQLRGEILRLAAWPRELPQELEARVHEELRNVADILGIPRVLMIWEEAEEPWLYVATEFHQEYTFTRESPEIFGPPVAPALADSDFFCLNARAPMPEVIHTAPDGLRRWHGAPLHADLAARFAITSVLCLNLRSEHLQGYLLLLDKPWMTADTLTLGGVVARLVRTDMDRFYAHQRLEEAAAAEERMRLARNLHDGLLQSLTAAGLQLETAKRLLEENPRASRYRLQDIQTLLLSEQRDLRSFVEQFKLARASSLGASADLNACLREMARKVSYQWGMRVVLALESPQERIGIALADELYHIVQEAVINAARHAHASTVSISINTQDDQIRVTVSDDGCGFPFRGRYNLSTLINMQLGPESIKQRIASLGGQLSIDSSESGARLEILLPVRRDLSAHRTAISRRGDGDAPRAWE